MGGWVNPRAGLDDVEKRKFLTLPGLEFRPLGRPARKLKEDWNEIREGRIKEEGREEEGSKKRKLKD
jgi:hypothetical protein